MPGIGHGPVGIGVEVAHHGVHLDTLADVPRHHTVVVTFLLHVLVIGEGALIDQEQRAVDVALDGRTVGREGEEQLVKTPDMFARLHGAVLAQILRERQHQRLAPVQDVDLLALLFGETEARDHAEHGYQRAQAEEHDTEKPNLPETCFDVF